MPRPSESSKLLTCSDPKARHLNAFKWRARRVSYLRPHPLKLGTLVSEPRRLFSPTFCLWHSRPSQTMFLHCHSACGHPGPAKPCFCTPILLKPHSACGHPGPTQPCLLVTTLGQGNGEIHENDEIGVGNGQKWRFVMSSLVSLTSGPNEISGSRG